MIDSSIETKLDLSGDLDKFRNDFKEVLAAIIAKFGISHRDVVDGKATIPEFWWRDPASYTYIPPLTVTISLCSSWK